ncbi:transposable element Tcb1 transposase [Trichonephila clavipes]|nr:transposable element Tcb1 transposase [Trichonephila clavipes]
MQVGQIGESLVIWVEEMRPLEDADKNEWTVADFSVRMYPGLIFQQDNAKLHTTRVAINCFTAYQTLPWPARSLSNRACPVYNGKATASTRGDVDDLVRQMKQIWQEIQQETIRELHHSMPHRGTTPY